MVRAAAVSALTMVTPAPARMPPDSSRTRPSRSAPVNLACARADADMTNSTNPIARNEAIESAASPHAPVAGRGRGTATVRLRSMDCSARPRGVGKVREPRSRSEDAAGGTQKSFGTDWDQLRIVWGLAMWVASGFRRQTAAVGHLGPPHAVFRLKAEATHVVRHFVASGFSRKAVAVVDRLARARSATRVLP